MRASLWLTGILMVTAGCEPAFSKQPSEVSVIYGQLTEVQRAEVFQWGQAYWEQVETGAVSAFVFSDPLMNSHLFNPLRATRATLERLKLWESTDCDQIIVAATPADEVLWEKRTRLKESMIDGKFVTDAVENYSGTQVHLDKLFIELPGNSATAQFEGSKLVSAGVHLDTADSVLGVAPPAQLGVYPPMTLELFATQASLTEAAPGLAAGCTNRTEAQKLVTGLPSRADQLELAIHAHMESLGLPAVTQRYDVSFGVYGSLPVIIVFHHDVINIVDGINGNVVGPYPTGSSINPLNHLSWHPEWDPTTSARAFNSSGCELKYAGSWTPWTPAPADVITPIPGLPGVGPSSLPGRPHDIRWDFTPPAGTTPGFCTSKYTRVVSVNPCPAGAPAPSVPNPAIPCMIFETVTCTWPTGPGGCVLPPGTAPNLPGPYSVPPGPAPWPPVATSCSTPTYRYWVP